MINKKEKRKNLVLTIIGIWISSILLLTIFISSKYSSNEKELAFIEKIYIDNLKNKIKDRIENLATLITTTYTNRFEAIDFMDNLEFDDGGYIFVLDINKTMLVHKNKMLTNVPFETMSDKRYKENVNNIVSSAIEKTNLFINYKQSKTVFSRNEELNKISYVKHLPSYNFILGTGLYDNDIRKELKSIKEELDKKLKEELTNIILYSIIAILAITTLLIFNFLFTKKRAQ